MLALDFVIIVGGTVTFYLGWKIWIYLRDIRRLPPGPTGLPFLGVVKQLDPTKAVQTILKWKEQYGDIFSFTLPAQYVVVVSSYELIKEVLLDRTDDFSGRPPNFRNDVLSNHHPLVGFMSDGPKYRVLKKNLGTSLKMYGERLLRLEDISLNALADLIKDWREKDGKPFDPQPGVHDVTVSIISSLAFGEPLDEEESKENLVVQKLAVKVLQPGGPGQILELFPWLRFFGLKAYKDLLASRDKLQTFMQALLQKSKDNFNELSPECVYHAVKASQEKVNKEYGAGIMTDADVDNQAIQLMGAGTATTFRSTHSFIAIITNHPALQTKLQKVVDDAIGTRQPRLADKDKLPLVEATIYELLRYVTVSPLLVPHCTMSDTTLNGYALPKGTQVWNFVFNLHHDPRYWDKPWEFRPERFLDENGHLVAPDHINKRRMLQFGAGRRVCAGEVLAKNRLFLILTSLVQNFTFKPKSETERPSSDPRTYRHGLAIHPQDFEICAIPR